MMHKISNKGQDEGGYEGGQAWRTPCCGQVIAQPELPACPPPWEGEIDSAEGNFPRSMVPLWFLKTGRMLLAYWGPWH